MGRTERKMHRDWWRVFLPLVGLFVLSSCASQSPVLMPTTAASPEETAGLVYVVNPGDTLSIIALQHGENYRDLARWNNIPPPYTIRPGQRLRLTPPATEEQAARTPSGVQTAVVPHEGASAKKLHAAVAKDADDEEETTGVPHWQWPAKGRVLRRFSSASKGVDIGGQEGDPVKAAADGTVVYSGTGIIGYGPLVIIKHNATYLSAYAHNKQLLVKDGDRVTKGQPIAEMGRNQRHRVMLHFEIRRNSKSVDPLQYLPAR